MANRTYPSTSEPDLERETARKKRLARNSAKILAQEFSERRKARLGSILEQI